MRTVLFVAAEAREFAGLLPRCSSVTKLDWHLDWAREARLNDARVYLVANGAGRMRAGEAARLARSQARFDSVVSVGFCGALDSRLRITDIVIPSCIHWGDLRLPVSTPATPRGFSRGDVITADRVIQTAAEKSALREQELLAVEMEAAGIALQVREWELPFYSVKAVTDLAHEDLVVDYNAARRPDGRLSKTLVLYEAIKRPRRGIGEVARLAVRSKRAAQALGEFLADCRFE